METKLPIGVQDFEKIRTEGYKYIDKTKLVYKIANNFNVCFLSRPRRFGKSLLVSTLEAYFLGRKELFDGLAIEGLEKYWTAYPVLRLDLNSGDYTDTRVNTPNDDAIVLKSSYALQKSVICEHILISNCTVSGYKLGTFFDGSYIPNKPGWGCGRIKLGTESNGGFRNIAISNCSFVWSCGLALEVVDRGVMENIVISNISMSHVRHYPIYITTGCRNRGPEDSTDISSARDIYIHNVIADDVEPLSGIIVTGMQDCPIRNISLSDIRIRYQGGGKVRTDAYPEQGARYPEPYLNGPTPAYGLYARHVDGLYTRNLVFELMSPDERDEIVLENVTRVQ